MEIASGIVSRTIDSVDGSENRFCPVKVGSGKSTSGASIVIGSIYASRRARLESEFTEGALVD